MSVDALKLEYDYVHSENVRLRDGRGRLTRQLGPLPISAAIVAGLVTGLAGDVDGDAYLVSALVLFGALVVISILYSNMKPYRALRREAESPRSTESPEEWYREAIALENVIYGKPAGNGFRPYLPRFKVGSLQEGYDRERTGLFIVQLLFAAVIVLLIVSRVT